MTLAEALEIVIARTKHERYRWLCSDANPDAESREAYRGLMVRLASDGDLPPQPPPPRPLSRTLELLSRMHACPSRTERADCGCAGLATCSLGKGQAGVVNHQDCFACLEASDAGE